MDALTYTPTADEEAGLAIELMKANGQLASQGKPPLDRQGLFELFVKQHLQPFVAQVLQPKMNALQQKYLDASSAEREQIDTAIAAVVVAKKS